MKKVSICLATLALLLVPQLASAATITISDVTGSFLSPIPVGCCTISNGPVLSTIRWGSGSTQSGYDFAAVIPPAVALVVPPSPSAWFQLAVFTHLNRTINPPSLSSVGLDVAVDLDVDGTPAPMTFSYVLSHTETPNETPCPAFHQAGNPPCDDQILISTPLSGQVVIGGVTYTLQLGFQAFAGGPILTEFITKEGADNVANLYGRFTAAGGPVIPEPSTFVLLGAGLIFLGRLKFRSRKAS